MSNFIRIFITKNSLWNFWRNIIAGMGLSWIFFEIFIQCKIIKDPSLCAILLMGIILGIICYFLEGYFFKGYLKNCVSFRINGATLQICFGDMFMFDGVKVISANEYFDTEVDDDHIAKKSLHGAFILKYFCNTKDELYDKIVKNLQFDDPEITERKFPARKVKYPQGSTAFVNASTEKFLVVALTHTDVVNNKAYMSLNEYHDVISQMLEKAYGSCSGEPLILPLIGDGQASLNIAPPKILSMLLLAIFEKSKQKRITKEIRIVLSEKYIGRINLVAFKEIWDN